MTVRYNAPRGRELSACGSQCLYTILSVSMNSWVVMETQPAQREPPWAPVTHPAAHSQTVSHPGHPTQGGGAGGERPPNLCPRAGLLLALRPQHCVRAPGGKQPLGEGEGGLLAAAPPNV